jgi:hypothetical protein
MSIFGKFVDKIQVSLKPTRVTGTVNEDRRMYDISLSSS